jgi:aminomethyltransferase
MIVALEPGDRLTVRDVHGGQRAVLVSQELGLEADLFGPESVRGAEEHFDAARAAVVAVSAPVGEPVLEGGIPASDLQLEIARAAPREDLEPVVPDPLAEPRLDFEVPRASARAYEVAAGEYIQVIDVKGRQCSDFLAFHSGKLEGGLERGLDATTTRSLMGNAYPQPGLYGKFYDQDQVPLVEVVRDTVGRHDTFALACYAKYYEDMGYFGHVNCSDNFNEQLLPYTIAARKGWPALNFFYNTELDSSNVLVSDEPWSRPGDYVLLRAMTDLVCLSSACPDDIDPANAWNPTEVRSRLSREGQFSVAIAHRVTGRRAEAPGHGVPSRTRRADEPLTGTGYWLPTATTGSAPCPSTGLPGGSRDHGSRRCAVGDPRPRRRRAPAGGDTRHPRASPTGRSSTAMCNDTAGSSTTAPSSGSTRRTSGSSAALVRRHSGCASRRTVLAYGCGSRIDRRLHNVGVRGRRAARCSLLIWTAPTQTPFAERRGSGSRSRASEAPGLPLIASRTGYSGELGYELFCHPKDAPELGMR